MRRWAIGLGFVLIAGVAAGQEAVFRSSNDIVRVFATVTDGSGRLVTTLGKQDFEIRDDGTARPITLFDNAPVPIRLIVLLDVSSSMTRNLALMRAGTEHLLTRLRADDLVRVGTFGGHEIEISEPFTKDLASLRLALPRATRSGGTPLWRGLDFALDAFGAVRDDERRVILVLSDGMNADYADGVNVTKQDVLSRARRDGVMIYCIGVQGGRSSLVLGGFENRPRDNLGDLAEDTGGGYMEIQPGQSLIAAFNQVANDLHAQYLLGFEPSKRDGNLHRIDIRVAREGMQTRGRRTYLAPKP
jgi:VWFA-related protein